MNRILVLLPEGKPLASSLDSTNVSFLLSLKTTDFSFSCVLEGDGYFTEQLWRFTAGGRLVSCNWSSVVDWRVWRRRVFVLWSDLEEAGEVFAAGYVRRQVDERLAVLGQGDLPGFPGLLAVHPARSWWDKRRRDQFQVRNGVKDADADGRKWGFMS